MEIPFKSELKAIIVAATAVGLIYSGYTLYQWGYSNAMATVDRENKIATDAAVEQAKKEWVSTQAITKQGMEHAQQQKQQIQYIIQKADKIVAPKCVDLGNDYSGVYNQYIDTIQGNANSGGQLPNGKVSGKSFDENAPKQ